MHQRQILNDFQFSSSNFKLEKLIKILLENRGIKTKKETEEFLNQKIEDITPALLEIKKTNVEKTLKRIIQSIEKKEQIIVFGDYDVDGICGSAILWETLRDLGANVMPYIPHRIDEGYGLSIKAITNLKKIYKDTKLIITVDNGIVANKPVDFASKKGIDVIITDHHVLPKKLPKAYSIFHSTKICGTAVAWVLAQELSKHKSSHSHLDLVALATVADLMPLTHENRTFVRYGLDTLHKTKRVGLLELFKEATLDKNKIGVYEIGHIIAPRLNATGRLEHAMDSLRLICTTDPKRAQSLALQLGIVNRQRQQLTKDSTFHAKTVVEENTKKKLIFIYSETYEPGIIGLVAGRLVEQYYRPAIVLSVGQLESKASARSIAGFNIIEFIRQAQEFMLDVGGHPMAAGFTVVTSNISVLQKKLEDLAEKMLSENLLVRKIKIDLSIPLSIINTQFYSELQKLSPFGMGNPEPTFLTKGVIVEDLRIVGNDGKHLKIVVSDPKTKDRLEVIAFGFGNQSSDLKIGDSVDIVYTIDENEWNGNKTLQLKIKDIKKIV